MVTEYSDGDYLYGADVDNIVVGLGRNGVISNMGVSQNATPNMSVDVAAGSCFAGETHIFKASPTNVSISASDPTNPRMDLIVINAGGTLSSVTGTPAASPNPPDLPDNSILFALVDVAATVTAIYNADITDRRLLLGSIQEEMIGANEIKTAAIADLQITNAKIAAAAGIPYSKLTLTGTILNADINGSAAIAEAKLAFAATGGHHHDGVDSTKPDHGDLLGLGDHDHTLYPRKAIEETISAIWNHTNDKRFYSEKALRFYTGVGSGFTGLIRADDPIGLIVETSQENIRFQDDTNDALDMVVETDSGGIKGGLAAQWSEQGQIGGVDTEFNQIVGEYLIDDDGNLGEYSEREDLNDLRAIRPWLDKHGKKLKTTPHGDPVVDAKTLPVYLKTKTHLRKNKGTNKEGQGYINNSAWKGWLISLHKLHDAKDLSHDESIAVNSEEILALKERLDKLEA